MGQEKTFWTADDVERIQALRAEGLDYGAIAVRLGRTERSVYGKLYKLAMGQAPVSGVRRAWSPQEEEQLKFLRDVENLSFTEISKIMGRPSGTVSSKHCYLRNKMPIAHAVEQRGVFVIPDEVHQDWRRRQMLSHRDLTSAFCGDPLPGLSALDQRT